MHQHLEHNRDRFGHEHVRYGHLHHPHPRRHRLHRRHHYGDLKQNHTDYAAPSEPRNFFADLFSGRAFSSQPDVRQAYPIHGRNRYDQPSREVRSMSPPATLYGPNSMVFNMRDHTLTVNGHVFTDVHSGNGRGYDNPYVQAHKIGAAPLGNFSVTQREGSFFGDEAWRVNGTPGRGGVLFHSAGVRLRGATQVGASQGCITIPAEQYAEFKQVMHQARPHQLQIRI